MSSQNNPCDGITFLSAKAHFASPLDYPLQPAAPTSATVHTIVATTGPTLAGTPLLPPMVCASTGGIALPGNLHPLGGSIPLPLA